MWRREDRRALGSGFWTPPPTWYTRKRVYTAMPMSERKIRSSSIGKHEPFHMIHKVSSGDSSYVRPKHAQLISKDLDPATSLFWAAINAGDRADIALQAVANAMEQLDRSDEGIQVIKSFRHLCSFESQDSIDSLLLELYKKSGKIQEETELLQNKLKTLEQDADFGGRITITKRSHEKQINLTTEKEKAWILGDLAWAHLQLHNYGIAEEYYRNALSLEYDNNTLCNLAICLIRMDRIPEAKSLLEDVKQSLGNQWRNHKSFERATEMLAERERATVADNGKEIMRSSSDNFSSSSSFASLMKEKQTLAKTGPEPVNMHTKNSHTTSESVQQKPLVPITQPQESKWIDEEVDQRIGAGKATVPWLKLGKTINVKHLKSVESAGSISNGKKLLDNNFIEKAKLMCAELIKEREDAVRGCQSRASESSSAYAQIIDNGQGMV